MVTVVFVCTGNTCRSPMAQVLLQDLLRESEHDFQILSAGTDAAEGSTAAGPAIQVMSRYGLSLEEHRSTRLSDELVVKAHVLLTMTEAHKDLVLRRYPEAEAKTFTLKQFVGLGGDVDDPFGGGLAEYEDTASELSSLLEAAAQRLLNEWQGGQ